MAFEANILIKFIYKKVRKKLLKIAQKGKVARTKKRCSKRKKLLKICRVQSGHV